MSKLGSAAACGLLASTALVRHAAAEAAEASERRQPMVGMQGTRLLVTATSTYDAEARTVDAVLSAGTAVRRRWFTEELEISAESIDLARVENGLVCLLDTHNQWETSAVLGRVSNVRVEDGELWGTLHFGEGDRAREVEGMVARGELRGISIGYKVTTWEITRTEDDGHETWRATRWELLEVSLVSVPADANAGIRTAATTIPGDGNSAASHEEDDMNRSQPSGAAAPAPAPTPQPPVQEQRAAPPAPAPAPAPSAQPGADVTRFSPIETLDFISDARSLGVEDQATALVRQNANGEIGAEAARSALLRAAGERQRADTAPTRVAAVPEGGPTNEEASRNAIVTALVARATGRSLTDAEQGSRQFMGLSILDIARERSGVSRNERDPDTIMRAAHTTSDFPILMEATGQRILLDRYQAQPPTFQRIARRRNLRDFRPTSLLRVGDFPTLLPYLEDGEIKYGTIGEGKETVQLGSFGRRLSLTRQVIINDDLGAFDEVFGSIGTMIAQFENAFFYTVKSQNGGLGPKLADGKSVFHADHGNLGTAAAMSVSEIGKGRAKIRKQKNTEGQVMNLAPRILLVGADSETIAEQITSPLVPQQVGNVNPFSGRLDVVAEGSIDDYSYELYADPVAAPVWVFGSLADAPAPRLMTKESWSTDGIGFRVTYDFYADAIDYRGTYRNPGLAPA